MVGQSNAGEDTGSEGPDDGTGHVEADHGEDDEDCQQSCKRMKMSNVLISH